MTTIIRGLEDALRFVKGEAPAVVTVPGVGTFEGRYWPRGQSLPDGWQGVASETAPDGFQLIRKVGQGLAVADHHSTSAGGGNDKRH